VLLVIEKIMKNRQQGFIVPLIIAIIALLAIISSGFYVYTNKKSASVPVPKKEIATSTPKVVTNVATTTTPATTSTTPIVQVSNTSGILTPKATFIEMQTKFDATKTFDEALSVSIEYATKERASFFRSQSAQLTEDMKTLLFPSLKSVMPPMSTITITSENITGDNAVLSLKNNNNAKETGTVTLKKESGIWKVEIVVWKQ
jgi:hypothetical protein